MGGVPDSCHWPPLAWCTGRPDGQWAPTSLVGGNLHPRSGPDSLLRPPPSPHLLCSALALATAAPGRGGPGPASRASSTAELAEEPAPSAGCPPFVGSADCPGSWGAYPPLALPGEVQVGPLPMCSARLPRDPATLMSYALHTQHIGCKCGWPNRTGTGGARGRLRFHQWPFASASRGATAVEWTEGLAPRLLLESLRHLPASHHNGFLGTLHPKPGRAPWEHSPKATQSPGGQAPRLNHAGQRGPGLTHHCLGQLGRGGPSRPRHRSGGEA